jgi:hypothetical protein
VAAAAPGAAVNTAPTDRPEGAVEYVMVPVPVELHARVLQYIGWRASSEGATGWDPDMMATLYAGLDESSRTLLTRVARGVVEEHPVTLQGIASATRASTREVLGIVLELVQRFKALGGPTFPLVLLDAPEGQSDDQRPVVMPKEGAQAVMSLADA